MHLTENTNLNSCEMVFLKGFVKECVSDHLKPWRRILPLLWLHESAFLLGTGKEVVLEGSVFT